eukprot:Sspe_Gene.51565::Locus_28624_Transcript_1_1_Confidence_1.000_Length_2598::g.51565::m.51565
MPSLSTVISIALVVGACVAQQQDLTASVVSTGLDGPWAKVGWLSATTFFVNTEHSVYIGSLEAVEKLPIPDVEEVQRISSNLFVVYRNHSTLLYNTDTKEKSMMTVKGEQASFTKVIPHPTDYRRLLATTSSSCSFGTCIKVYHSTDGVSFSEHPVPKALIRTVDWENAMVLDQSTYDKDAIMELVVFQLSAQLWISDLTHPNDHPVVGQTDAVTFLNIGRVTFIVGRNIHADSFELYTSTDNLRTVRRAKFESSLPQGSFTILDDSEDVAFLNVYHYSCSDEAVWGHTYLSDKNIEYFDLALKYTRRNFGKRNPRNRNLCDFHKVEGLTGVYIANRIINPESRECKHCEDYEECEANCHFETVISYEKGAVWSWKPLRPPANEDCGNLTRCFLHLHGMASDDIRPIMSKAHSPGVIMAVGHVGEYLDVTGKNLSLYMSFDAGQTWEKHFDGHMAFEWLDYGGFIIAVERDTPVRAFHYSNNGGQSWDTAQFIRDSDPATQVMDIEVPGGDIFGGGLAKWVAFVGYTERKARVYTVDLSTVAGTDCDPIVQASPFPADSAYEEFYPVGDKCFLGAKRRYVRKKRGQSCWNPEENQDITREVTTRCTCTLRDYDCDVAAGYRSSTKGCVPGDASREMYDLNTKSFVPIHAKHPYKPPCEDGEYTRTKGYVLIPGDVCDLRAAESLDLTPTVESCGSGRGGTGAGTVFLIILLILAVLGGGVYLYQNPRYIDMARDRVSACIDQVTALAPGYLAVPQMELGEYNSHRASESDSGSDLVPRFEPQEPPPPAPEGTPREEEAPTVPPTTAPDLDGFANFDAEGGNPQTAQDPHALDAFLGP